MKEFWILFTYDVVNKQPKERMKIQRKLYGFTDYSHYGQYKYRRAGLLTKIPHLNPTKSCIIVRKQNARTLRNFFQKCKIKWDERRVLLTEKEIKKLKTVEADSTK